MAGIGRRRLLYDAVLAAHSSAPLARLEARLLAALRIGLHQIVELDRMPVHAAVATAVDLLPGRKARGFANAVLRTILREGRRLVDPDQASVPGRRFLPAAPGRGFLLGRDVLPDPVAEAAAHRALLHSFSAEAAALLESQLGDRQAGLLMARAGLRPRVSLRPRPTGADRQALRAELEAEGLELEPEDGGELLLVRRGDPTASAAFRRGAITVQGPFAARVAPLLAPRGGERILDLCAPPGGKTAQLADLDPGARILAFARDDQGARRLEENLRRLELQGRVELVREAPFDRGPHDAMLLDVPCSNSGVLARRPEARDRLTSKDLRSLTELQEELLRAALAALPRGARLVYSTCSVLPVENEELLRRVLEGRSGLRIATEERAFPDEAGADGGYAALVFSEP